MHRRIYLAGRRAVRKDKTGDKRTGDYIAVLIMVLCRVYRKPSTEKSWFYGSSYISTLSTKPVPYRARKADSFLHPRRKKRDRSARGCLDARGNPKRHT